MEKESEALRSEVICSESLKQQVTHGNTVLSLGCKALAPHYCEYSFSTLPTSRLSKGGP